MRWLLCLVACSALTVSLGCTKEEVLQESREVLSEQKFKAVEGVKDIARDKLDNARENTVGALNEEDKLRNQLGGDDSENQEGANP